jgi:hypothetical protein
VRGRHGAVWRVGVRGAGYVRVCVCVRKGFSFRKGVRELEGFGTKGKAAKRKAIRKQDSLEEGRVVHQE